MRDARGVGDDNMEWATVEALRDDRRIRVRVSAANAGGAVLVAIESVLVGLPSTQNRSRFLHDNLVSLVVMVGYLAVTLIAGNATSRRRVDRAMGWVDERRRPTRAEVDAVLRFPWFQAREIFALWLGGAVTFVVLNLVLGNSLVWSSRVGLGIVLGGLTSAALSFLLLERFNRPLFARVLAGEATDWRERFGLQHRLLVTWALGAAVPVLVIVTAPAGLSAPRRANLAGPVLVLGVIALAAGLVLTFVASRSITDPIAALRESQRRVGDGDLDVEVQVDDGGEVGLLQAGFNRMVAGLRERQRIQDLFGRHVGVEVARAALTRQARLGGEVCEASMLFVDVIGSTRMAQRLGAEEVVGVLNEFFAAVVRSAASEGGWVNKFEGDAALCVFGPPGDVRDHAARALRAGRRLRAELRALAARHEGFDAGIGISSGNVVAGNVGAEDRYEYTVIGDPVNEAARLAELAKADPGRVSASGATLAAAGDVEGRRWSLSGAHVLRGRDGTTDVYSPLAAEGVPIEVI